MTVSRIIGCISLCFVWGSEPLFAIEATTYLNLAAKNNRKILFPRSETHQCKTKTPFVHQTARQLVQKSSMGQGAAVLDNSDISLDPKRYTSTPKAFEVGNEDIYIYPRIEDGTPFEDAYAAIYRRPSYPPRVFYKGTAAKTTKARVFDYEGALEKAKTFIEFDDGQDTDYTLEQEKPLSYRYTSKTDLFHEVYTFLFYLKAEAAYVELKVDLQTGDIIAFHPLKAHDSGTHAIKTKVHKTHILSKKKTVPLPQLAIELEDAEGMLKHFRTDTSGEASFDAESFSKMKLVFENSQIQVGYSGGTANEALPVSPFKKSFTLTANSPLGNNFTSWLPLDVTMPFYYLQQGLLSAGSQMSNVDSGYALPVVVDYSPTNQRCNAYYGYEIKAGNIMLRPSHFVFYGPSTGQCQSAGLSTSIIYHELGHYLDFKTGGISDSASSEGFGDVMAMLHLKSPIIGAHYKDHFYNHYIRDLRIDRSYPLHRGEVHFEGEILGSAFWNLILAWQSIYSAEWTYRTLKTLFLKAMTMASNMHDMPQSINLLLSRDPKLKSPNHLQCSVNAIFSKQGLGKRLNLCDAQSPQVSLSYDEPKPYESGENLSVSVNVKLPSKGFVGRAYIVGSLWMDDKQIQKRTKRVSALVGGDNDFESLLQFKLPERVDSRHRYSIRVGYTDRKRHMVFAEKNLPIERKVKSRETYYRAPNSNLAYGQHVFPIQITRNGFVDGDILIKVNLESTDDALPVSLYLRTRHGKKVTLAFDPPSLKAISGKWMRISHLMQGESPKDITELLVIHRRMAGASLNLKSYNVKMPISEKQL